MADKEPEDVCVGEEWPVGWLAGYPDEAREYAALLENNGCSRAEAARLVVAGAWQED